MHHYATLTRQPACRHAGIACALALAASALAPAHASGPYTSFGLPGMSGGYAHSVNDKLGLRVEGSTTGSINKTDTASGIPFAAKFRYDRASLLGDFFLFSGGFRVTGGVTINRATLELRSRFNGATVTVNGKNATPSSSDYLNAQLKYPTVMPYVGIGWGHQAKPTGVGFTADVGVSIGRPKLSVDTNLVGQSGITQEDIDAKRDELRDDIGDIELLPSASVGLNYRF